MDASKVERIKDWMNSHLSIARFSGGCIIDGTKFIICPVTNDLVREDIFKTESKATKHERTKAKKERVGPVDSLPQQLTFLD